MSTIGKTLLLLDGNRGLRGSSNAEVSMAQVLGKAGYATAFYRKWHLGDSKPSYPTEKGFDEAFWTPYNQVPEKRAQRGHARATR